MDRGVRIAAAASVLVGGVVLAMLFRHPSPPGAGAAFEERLVLRQGTDAPAADGAAGRGAGRTEAAGVFSGRGNGRPPTVVKPQPARENPPELARDFPGASAAVTAEWNPAVGSKAGGGEEPAAQTHKVVDGDTLPALAQRYLGSADRAAEIYELNRAVLPGPGVLPIGVQLKLPPRKAAQPAPPNLMPQRRDGSGQSAVGSRQSAVGSRQWAVGSDETYGSYGTHRSYSHSSHRFYRSVSAPLRPPARVARPTSSALRDCRLRAE